MSVPGYPQSVPLQRWGGWLGRYRAVWLKQESSHRALRASTEGEELFHSHLELEFGVVMRGVNIMAPERNR